MASNSVVEGLTADVTCSICLEMFDKPKLMPNCPHTFCLKCLKLIQPEQTNPPKIRCPECRELNIVPKDGVEGFLSNLVAYNITEKVRAQHHLHENIPLKSETRGIVCDHTATSVKRANCRHCSKKFCQSCKYRHVEELREKVTALSRTNQVLLQRLFEQNIVSKIKSILERDVRSVQMSLVPLEKGIKSVLDAVMQFQAVEGSRIRNLFETVSDTEEISSLEQRQNRLASISIFKQELSDVDQLYNDVSKRSEQLELLTRLSYPDASFLSFELKDVFKQSDHFEFGTFKLPPCGSKFQCKLPQPQITNLVSKTNASAQSVSTPFTSNAASRRSPVPIPFSSLTNLPPPLLECDLGALFVIKEGQISRPQRIIGHIYNNGYIVSHNDCCISLFDYRGALRRTFCIQFSPAFKGFRIDDMSTDFGSTLFFSANVIHISSHAATRQIYRFSLTEKGNNVIPGLFAESDHQDCFRGLAASKRWRWLITTDHQDLVAYKSIDASRRERGEVVFRSYLGPSPYVYRTRVDDETICLNIVCSTNGVLRCCDVYPNENNRATENVWRIANSSEALMTAGYPWEFCYWGKTGLLVVGDSIQVGEGLPYNPVLQRTFPLTLTSSPASAEKCVGIGGVTVVASANQSRTCFTVIYPSGRMKFAQLTNECFELQPKIVLKRKLP